MADGDNKVYVFDDGANKHEGMTKSEIMDTIVEMMETGQVTGGIYIDAVKEQNAGESLKFWVGTQAQYEALPEIDPYIDYKITDANTLQEIDAALTQLKEQLTSGAFKVKSAYTADDVKTSINGKAISEIFESDGKTAKKATIATADENGNNIMASYALKDDLQDAEGDIDALEGRMTTAEGDIVALEAEQQTNAKLTQVVRVDAAQSLTDEEKTRAKDNVVINTEKAPATGISTGWYRVAKLDSQTVYSVTIGQSYNYFPPTNVKLALNLGYQGATITQESGILSGNLLIDRVRVCVGTTAFFDVHIFNANLNTTKISIDRLYSSDNAVAIETYEDWEYIGTSDTVTGYNVTQLDIVSGTNTSGGVYQNGAPVFATDPSKLAPSTANGWTETTVTGSLPSAGAYLIYACMNKQTVTTNNESSIAMIIYDGQGDDRCATPVMWLSAPAFLVYKNGSWEMKRMDKSEVAQPYRIMYKRIA